MYRGHVHVPTCLGSEPHHIYNHLSHKLCPSRSAAACSVLWSTAGGEALHGTRPLPETVIQKHTLYIIPFPIVQYIQWG